ncbi:MAG: hypothetical protein M0Z94_05115, partial [Dehalococcoidales bacterium]|nr:hypothetical protein [Dehalococcoidales bacterium]
MVHDLWVEQFGGRGIVGQAEKVRNLEAKVADHASQIDECKERLLVLETAPAKEALEDRQQAEQDRKAVVHYALGSSLAR